MLLMIVTSAVEKEMPAPAIPLGGTMLPDTVVFTRVSSARSAVVASAAGVPSTRIAPPPMPEASNTWFASSVVSRMTVVPSADAVGRVR